MDTTDSAVIAELERRLDIIGRERGMGYDRPLPRTDLVASVLIVAVAVLVGLVAGAV